MTTILVDGDVYAYQASSAVERVINWGDDDSDDHSLFTLHADADEARGALDTSLAILQEQLASDRMVIALSDVHNWRHEVMPSYKGNRKTTRKPLCLAAVRSHLREHYEVWESPGLEGDDVLGILMTSDEIIPGDKLCVSIDKDLRTIPGKHWVPNKPNPAHTVSEVEAECFHLYQTLTGDVVDGYGGCPGVGHKTAIEFLNEPYELVPTKRTIKRGARAGEEITEWLKKETGDVWAGIVSLYAKAGYNEEYALQQARVARILRACDYDFRKKEPILWNPY